MDFNHLVDRFQLACDKHRTARLTYKNTLWSWKRVIPGCLNLKKQALKLAEHYLDKALADLAWADMMSRMVVQDYASDEDEDEDEDAAQARAAYADTTPTMKRTEAVKMEATADKTPTMHCNQAEKSEAAASHAYPITMHRNEAEKTSGFSGCVSDSDEAIEADEIMDSTSRRGSVTSGFSGSDYDSNEGIETDEISDSMSSSCSTTSGFSGSESDGDEWTQGEESVDDASRPYFGKMVDLEPGSELEPETEPEPAATPKSVLDLPDLVLVHKTLLLALSQAKRGANDEPMGGESIADFFRLCPSNCEGNIAKAMRMLTEATGGKVTLEISNVIGDNHVGQMPFVPWAAVADPDPDVEPDFDAVVVGLEKALVGLEELTCG